MRRFKCAIGARRLSLKPPAPSVTKVAMAVAQSTCNGATSHASRMSFNTCFLMGSKQRSLNCRCTRPSTVADGTWVPTVTEAAHTSTKFACHNFTAKVLLQSNEHHRSLQRLKYATSSGSRANAHDDGAGGRKPDTSGENSRPELKLHTYVTRTRVPHTRSQSRTSVAPTPPRRRCSRRKTGAEQAFTKNQTVYQVHE